MCVASTVGPLTAYRSRGLYVVYPDATSRIRPITAAYRLYTFIPMRVYRGIRALPYVGHSGRPGRTWY